MSGLIERVRAARRLPPPSMARAIRDTAGVSQQQLADELGINRVTVARWELGTREPRGHLRLRYIDVLEQLAAVLSGEGTRFNESSPPAATARDERHTSFRVSSAENKSPGEPGLVNPLGRSG